MKCEIVVVGSGPGGAITAALLAEHGRDVVLLEEGEHLPPEICRPFSMEEMERKYRHGGLNPAMCRPKIAFVEGRCVGGGSEINAGLYHRTPPEILDLWKSRFGLEGVESLTPLFEANERDLSVGPSPGSLPLTSLKLQEGAGRLNWKAVEVPSWCNQRGERQTMTRTFLPRAMAAGCRLLPETRAERLRRRSRGWEVLTPRESIEAEHVFVAAGAVQTPRLLRASGITTNVGNTLAMHPTIKLTARFSEDVNPPGMGVPGHQVKEFAPRLTLGCSISSQAYLALAMLDHGENRDTVRHHGRQMAIYYAMIAGDPTGTVRSIGGDALVRYRLSVADYRDLAGGLRKLATLLLAAGAIELFPSIAGSAVVRSEKDLRTIPESIPPDRTSLMTVHLFSSCPIGENRKLTAADSFGRVHGLPGLYLADASVLPTAPGVNPQGSIMAFARRNALHFLGKL